MPKYCVIVTNQSDTEARPPIHIGSSQVEYCEAPDPETVDLMVRKSISRTGNPNDYTWTITEQPA
jgi:hypothetical protein